MSATGPPSGKGVSQQRCSSISITWTYTGDIDLVDISYFSPGVPPQLIVTGLPNTGSYVWNILCNQVSSPHFTSDHLSSHSLFFSFFFFFSSSNSTGQTVAPGYNIIVAWSNPTRLQWWNSFCGAGPACQLSAVLPQTFSIGYCTLCGNDFPPGANSLSPGSCKNFNTLFRVPFCSLIIIFVVSP